MDTVARFQRLLYTSLELSFIRLSNSTINKPTPQVPQRGPYGHCCPFPETFIYISLKPSFVRLSKSTINKPPPPPGLPTGSLWTLLPLSKDFFYTSLELSFIRLSKSTINKPTPQVPQRGPYGHCCPFPEPFIYTSL